MDQVQTLLSLQLPSVVHAHVPATGAVEHAEQSYHQLQAAEGEYKIAGQSNARESAQRL